MDSKHHLLRLIEQQHHQTPNEHSEDHSRYRECQGFPRLAVTFKLLGLHGRTKKWRSLFHSDPLLPICARTVTIAIPVVRVKARSMATNIFFISSSPVCGGQRNDIALNIRMMLLRENTYHGTNPR
jgi:hypothetical protein